MISRASDVLYEFVDLYQLFSSTQHIMISETGSYWGNISILFKLVEICKENTMYACVLLSHR